MCFYILTQDATCISCCESQLKGLKAEKPCYDGMSITFLASLYVSTSFIPAIAEYLSKPFCAYVMTPPLPFHLPGPAAVLFDSTPLKNLNPLPIRAHHTFLFVPIVHFHIPLFSIFHSAWIKVNLNVHFSQLPSVLSTYLNRLSFPSQLTHCLAHWNH